MATLSYSEEARKTKLQEKQELLGWPLQAWVILTLILVVGKASGNTVNTENAQCISVLETTNVKPFTFHNPQEPKTILYYQLMSSQNLFPSCMKDKSGQTFASDYQMQLPWIHVGVSGSHTQHIYMNLESSGRIQSVFKIPS